MSLLWWLACAAPEVPSGGRSGGDSAPDTGAALADLTREVEVEVVTACASPPSDYVDPLRLRSDINLIRETRFPRVHLVDIEVDRESGRAYAAGMGGVLVFDVSDGAPVYLGAFQEPEEVLEVEVLGGDRVAAGHRDAGWKVLDFKDPAAPEVIAAIGQSDLGALTMGDGALYALRFGGVLETFAPDTVEKVHRLSDVAASPWAMVVSGSWGYIADHGQGIVVVDLSSPKAPSLTGTVIPAAGGLQDLAVEGDTLVAAVGAAGVEFFSLADPATPASVALLPFGDAVISVDIEGGLVWATSYNDVLAIDGRDVANPVALGSHATPEWAMDVVSLGGAGAVVADWSKVSRYTADIDARAPDIDLRSDTMYFSDGDASAELVVSNRGGADLNLLGAELEDPRFELFVTAEDVVIPPGGSATLEVSFVDDGERLESALCLATNDPDQPVLEVSLTQTTAGTSVAVGEAAIDFVLEDLNGELHQLSDHLGQPVMLVFFATWCPACASEVSDIESSIWQTYRDEGLVVWGIGGIDEDYETVANFVEYMGLTYPILIDADGSIFDAYTQQTAFGQAFFPQEWIIGADGRVAYVNNTYEPDAIIEIIERELGL
jgi:peroxiredoxin